MAIREIGSSPACLSREELPVVLLSHLLRVLHFFPLRLAPFPPARWKLFSQWALRAPG